MTITSWNYDYLEPTTSAGQYMGSYGSITAYGSISASRAASYALALQNAAASLVPPVITPVFPTFPSAPPIQTADPPTLETAVWELPGIPAAFGGSLNVDALLPDPFDASPPTLNFGSAPAPFNEVMPAAPGVNVTWTDPTLEVNLPSAPSLLSITTTQFGGLNFPTIDFTVPELTVVAPSVREYVPGSMYNSSLLTAAKETLERWIVDGGTALPPEVEEAIWNRAREREYRQAADAVADLEKMEALGYAFPPGVYVNARIKINTETAYNIQTISREIAIEQAKLEQQNIGFALDKTVALEGQLMNYTNAVEQRAFESVKYATEAGIAIYNARVQAYAAYLDAYKTKVAIYEAQIRAEQSKVEAYKATIDAERVKAEINTALINQYKTQADVALANVEIYKAEIAGIQAKAQIEQLKIQIFGEQVKAYATKVNAYTAGVEGFRATIQAEGSKQEAFKSQVEAYSAQVGAAAKVIDAKIEEYKGLLTAKQTEWEGYKAAVQAASVRVQATASLNQSLADMFRAEASAVGTYNEVLTKQWQVAVDQSQRVAEIGVSAAKANAEIAISARSLVIEANKVGAQVNAQIGAAALGAANWSFSASVSEAFSKSNSVSSQNPTTSYSYSESATASV